MHFHRLHHSHGGFTLVELIVGMTIFAVGMTAILALLSTTIESSFVSRHEIVASNLLREQIELMKNVRNSNVRSFVPWDSTFTGGSNPGFLSSGTYLIQNDYGYTTMAYDDAGLINHSPVSFTRLSTLPSDIESRFTDTRLKLDEKNRYNHTSGTGTNYASYIIVTPLIIQAGGSSYEPKSQTRNQGFILDARVIAKSRGGYREYDLKTVITDWKK